MHKIRLYVVPEQEETTENDDPNDIDLPPMLNRRNSRRPGAVRVNVLQKTTTESNDSDIKLVEVIKQDLHQRNNQNLRNNSSKGPLRAASLSNARVLASPRIKKIAHDLQEKMLQSSGNRSRNENNNRKIEGSRVVIKHSRIERNTSGISNAGYKRAARECPRSHCRKDQYQTGHSPKIVRVKDEVDGMENRDGIGNSNDANLAALGRNNKLNGYREYDLEQKIEVEIKMREGSARLLAAARHRAQSLEAARALLTSNERMSAYMAELQRRKKEPISKPSNPASTARVSLSELRVPLMWRDSDHFKNRGDYRRFAVFCLARIGTEIHDTALLCPVDRALTDITFPDVLLFNNVPADFELTLEIYSHILQEDLSIASTPRRIKRTIHSSISKTVGKKLAASLRDELNSGKIGPHFELMASAKLTLDDTDENIHTHDLVINNLENKHHALPLFGHFCCRLAAQPDCMTKEITTGSVNINGRDCWARLQNFNIQSWESRKLAEGEQNPIFTIPINKETSIQPTKCQKEVKVINTSEGTEKPSILKFESSEEAQKWLRHLTVHSKDHERWKHAAETVQEVPCMESARNSFISSKRQGSLYDETPLIESVQSDYTSHSRPTVQEIFGLTPSTSLSSCSSNSPPSHRSRSHSTSGSRKLSAAAIKSHWPFSNKHHD
ncbi:rhotekin [Fopius arisanus]|uniref:Rhotekin n=1 Tax=Fopius arisanus TaxID=64838 RepID=A0A9R1TZZ3_9HYME|nr:PREDICTED: rhotekin-like [Fopius arisanus]XP_011302259.1 PREDICTED: rhotekin-like [Fopius arisanus]